MGSCLMLWFIAVSFLASVNAKLKVINSSCPGKCGNVSIPYPFGTKEGCYRSEDFNIDCKSGTPVLKGSDPLLKIQSISVDNHELIVNTPVVSNCYNKSGSINGTGTEQTLSFSSPKFPFSNTRNRFTAVGCDTMGMIATDDYLTGCFSYCTSSDAVDNNSSCSGDGSCQTANITTGLYSFNISLEGIQNRTGSCDFGPCDYAFVVADSCVFQGAGDLKDCMSSETVPAVLDWDIRGHNCSQAKPSPGFACKGSRTICVDSPDGLGYYCQCSRGFKGNPYVLEGCTDICEHQTCKSKKTKLAIIAAVMLGIVLITGSFVLWRYTSKKRIYELRCKYFRRNGGPILQESLSQVEDARTAFKIFTAEEMEAATNNFDENRIVGRGGFGVVYKGYLSDGRVVAIKKSKSVDKCEMEQFVNEVILLSKIQHQNVVGFYGCCLEKSRPLLVYEFLTNGTLSDHLYSEDDSSVLSWETRLKIAVETAGALGYLHQDHRTQIIHSDIKPQNILLDDNYNAKVADFGISKMAPENENELYTKVKGTWGYLDPEFIQTSLLTDKSDVYSFGVVLLELLTRQRVLSFLRPEKDRSLVKYFQSSVSEGNLVEILDKHIANEENVEELKIVAEVAGRCTSVKAAERPNMKEVAMELGSLWIEVRNRSNVHSWDVEQKSGSSIGNGGEHFANTSSSYGDSISTDYILPLQLDGGR